MSLSKREAAKIDREKTGATLQSLDQVSNATLAELSALTLPEIKKLKAEIAAILPAGNLPGLILSGLTQLKSRTISRKQREQDINALFQGSGLLPGSLYSLLFAGPAVVLAAYQQILTLAGKDIDSAFPEGTWQFYLQFGLREDTGRHTCETIAFNRDRLEAANDIDDITAWVMTAIYTLFDTNGLTGALWTEWTTLRLMGEVARDAGLSDQRPFATMLRDWQASRPYQTPAGSFYADERRRAFSDFAKRFYDHLPPETVELIQRKLHELAEQERIPYQDQMNLLAYLKPGRYRDERLPIPMWNARVGLILGGHIYLFNACWQDSQGKTYAFTETGEQWPLRIDNNGNAYDPQNRPLTSRGGWLYRQDDTRFDKPVAYLAPPDAATIKGLVTQIVQSDFAPSDSLVDLRLSQAPRAEQEALRKALPPETQESLRKLDLAPILINWDLDDRNMPLGVLRRQAKRGIGDHPLTVINTGESMVFDLSHIFFDGLWGMAIAEVMTNQAIGWRQYIGEIEAYYDATIAPLVMTGSKAFDSAVARAMQSEIYLHGEASAESVDVDMGAIATTRGYLYKRGVSLTVNDILVLSRVIHAARYQVDPSLQRDVESLPGKLRETTLSSLISSTGSNPVLLIPVDASFSSPRERLFPTTFRNPLTDLLEKVDTAVLQHEAYHSLYDEVSWEMFDEARRHLFSYLQTFGQILNEVKTIAMRGESFSTATIRLLAHLPMPMQEMLDQIPQQVSVLNEVVKGEEVFSNGGRVAKGSSLVRFLSAKDDGRAKRFVWGFLTDDQDVMHISLRDFRPHVDPMIAAGQPDLAAALAQDYLDSYVSTLNGLVAALAGFCLSERKHNGSKAP